MILQNSHKKCNCRFGEPLINSVSPSHTKADKFLQAILIEVLPQLSCIFLTGSQHSTDSQAIHASYIL